MTRKNNQMLFWRFYFLAVLSAFLATPAWAGRIFEQNDFKIPDQWKMHPAGKRDFYFESPWQMHKQIIQTKEGERPFGEGACWKKGVIRVKYNDMKDDSSDSYLELLKNRDNPIVIYCSRKFEKGDTPFGCYVGHFDNTPPSDWDVNVLARINRDFGKRFIGISGIEWYRFSLLGNECRASSPEECLKQESAWYHLPVPKTRDDAWNLFQAHFLERWGKHQKAGIPIYLGQATFLNHWECRMGSKITGEEIGSLEICTPMQLAFSRGASRQYNVPWAVYIASFGGGIMGDANATTRYQFLRPDERRMEGKADYGPYSGPSLSLMKRILYASYMSGTAMVRKEADNFIFFANYDEDTADSTPPRILILQDKKTYLSPLGRIYEWLYDNIAEKHQRGIPYTPIALIFDRNHGCVLEYMQKYTVSRIPYGPGEYQTRSVINTIFPWEERTEQTKSWESNTQVTGPFGDIFDALTDDADINTLKSYPCLALVGNVRMNEGFEERLKEYLKNGGVAFMSVEQLTPELWRLAGLEDGGEELKASKWQVSGEGKTVDEGLEFIYRKARLKGAEALITAGADGGNPLTTIKQHGKGAIIVGLAGWMMVPGKEPNRMLKVYSEVMGWIADELAPVKVTGNVEKLYNRNDKGWVVTLINNDGICKYPGKKEVVKMEEAITVKLEPRFAYGNVGEWLTGEPLKDLSVIVPPGDIRIVEFEIKKNNAFIAETY